MATKRIKENAMSASRIAIAMLWLATAGCFEQVVVNPNNAPIADARAIPPGGMATEAMVEVPYEGAPVTVTLDATQSRDGDGSIKRYRWFSGVDSDAGTARVVPEGQPADWPADEASTDVVLGEGDWTFTLFVEDDEGVFSEPDTILVKVGVAMDPVAECAGQVVDVVAEACRNCLCAIESCRPMVIESGCDAACWGLIQCIGANCPDFQAMAAMMDYSCLTTNCMAQYTAATGGGTPMGATPAGACARMCPGDCSSMAM